jgi:hypothetical protein
MNLGLKIDTTEYDPASILRLSTALAERDVRRFDALRLYEPMPLQEAFHKSKARTRLFLVGNQYGKTLAAAVEFARAIRGMDPYGKYPKKDGRIYVVGKSLKHIADTIYQMLFRAVAFKVIRDEVTGEWRSWKPWIQADRDRESEAIYAPPLLSENLIESVGWKSKARGEIDLIRFAGGWEAHFFTAEGPHPQGSKVDLVWLDEEIQRSKKDGSWYTEMSARIIMRKGRIIWTAAPQKGFEELHDLYQLGLKQEAEHRLDPVKYPEPNIAIFQGKQEDNVFMSAADRIMFEQTLSAEERLARSAGQFNFSTRLIYPEFSLSQHGYPMDGPVPPHWTRYVFIDPGHQICAALFVGCPPPEECPDKQPMAVAYDELYIPQCNAVIFGLEMKMRSDDQQFESFTIDMHGARPTEAGSGKTIYAQYEEQLRANQVRSLRSGYGFLTASDDITAGITMGHTWLARRRHPGAKSFDIPPRFRVRTNADRTASACPNFVWEMSRYPKQTIGGRIFDKPNDRGPTHLCQCFRYCVMQEPGHVPVQMVVNQRTIFRNWMDQLIADQGSGQTTYLSFGRSL